MEELVKTSDQEAEQSAPVEVAETPDFLQMHTGEITYAPCRSVRVLRGSNCFFGDR